MNKIFIEIGGNEGDRLKNIRTAIKLIAQFVGEIKAQSSIFETPPWGFKSEQYFYNQVLLVDSILPFQELLSKTLLIEKQMGRVRGSERYSSRTMDIDILFFNNEIINTDTLIVPHPRLHLRRFVLEPLFEIDKNHKHPIFNKTVEQLLVECEDNSECIRLNND